MTNPNLAAALEYGKRGWPVFPIHTPGKDGLCTCGVVPCPDAGKHPRTTNGFKDASGDPETIRRWWSDWHNANVGVCTGRHAGIWVLDIDPRHGGDVSFQKLIEQHGPIHPTRSHKTGGGGMHYIFSTTDEDGKPVTVPNSTGEIAPGIDVKGEGGYIIVPPSLHASGGRYEVGDDVPVWNAPAWLLDMAMTPKTRRGGAGAQGERMTIPDTIPEGSRNATIYKMGCSLRSKGWTEGAIAAALHEENAAKCKPPLPDGEVDSIIVSVLQLPPGMSAGAGAGGPRENGTRPRVMTTNTRLRDISDQSIDHLVATNYPERLFVRTRGLVRIGNDEKGIAVIERLNEHSLRGILERTCDYIRLVPNLRSKKLPGELVDESAEWLERSDKPSNDLVNDILSLGSWPFPVVESVVQTPIIHLDGSIIAAAGYDPQTLSYYAPPNGTTIPGVPDIPSDQDVKDAAKLLWEPFIDFPFIDESSKTHIAAAVLTIILRPVIPGVVPAFIIDKPAPGTGASLIASILSVIAQGGDAAVIQAPKSDEEWGKKITSTLRAGVALVNVDNIEHKLYAPALAALLTSTIWRDRILGLSELITLANRTVWVLNGNNVTLGGDLPRRVIWSRMDAVSERPWQRERETPYTHPDVLAWTHENRGRILAAVLTLTRYWISKGRPGPGDVPKLGGFERWRDIVGGILASAGFAGFLGNLEDVYSEMDLDGSQWDGFVSRWFEIWGENPITSSEIIDQVKRENDSTNPLTAGAIRITDVLPDDIADAINDRKGSPSKRVGNAIRKRKDRVFYGGLRLVKAGTKQRAVTWKIKRIEKQSGSQTHQTHPPNFEKVSLQKNASVEEVSLVSLSPMDRAEVQNECTTHRANRAPQTHQTHSHDENPKNANSLFPENREKERFHQLIGKYDIHPDLDVSGHTRFKKAGSHCSCKGCGSPGDWHDLNNTIRPAPLCDQHYQELKEAGR